MKTKFSTPVQSLSLHTYRRQFLLQCLFLNMLRVSVRCAFIRIQPGWMWIFRKAASNKFLGLMRKVFFYLDATFVITGLLWRSYVERGALQLIESVLFDKSNKLSRLLSLAEHSIRSCFNNIFMVSIYSIKIWSHYHPMKMFSLVGGIKGIKISKVWKVFSSNDSDPLVFCQNLLAFQAPNQFSCTFSKVGRTSKDAPSQSSDLYKFLYYSMN